MWSKLDVITHNDLEQLFEFKTFYLLTFHIPFYCTQRNPFGHFSDKPFAPDIAIPWQTKKISVFNFEIKSWVGLTLADISKRYAMQCSGSISFSVDEISCMVGNVSSLYGWWWWTQYPCLTFPVPALARLGGPYVCSLAQLWQEATQMWPLSFSFYSARNQTFM